MFYLHASNKTENLLRHLAALIEADPPTPLAETECLLIQSQGMERKISQFMAEYFASWCNYRYFLPLEFLEYIAEKTGQSIQTEVFDRTVLCWRIEEKLRDIDEAVYHPLRRYIQGERVEMKRFQLARQIADMFDQYQLMRPLMLKKWRQGVTVTDEPAEVWQMHLWNRLVEEAGEGRPRGDVVGEVVENLNARETISGLPRRISVFGVHILPPLFLDYLSGLSRHCDVHLFLLSPCRQYWGDVRRKASVLEAMDKEAVSHPLLASLGGQGRDFQELLLDKVEFAGEITSYDDPADSDNPRLLHRLQSDLLAGELTDGIGKCTNDGSIRVVSCHSRMRELAVLRDHIIDIMEQDGGLELGDIVVMAPDIQEYAPFIPAVFEDIQHSIADRSLYRRNAHITLFHQFLALFSGRFGWSEVFDLLENEQVHRCFDLAGGDIEKLRNWVVASGIRWGLSPRTREEGGFLFGENSWQSGLERLLMGVAIDSEEEVASVLPFNEIEGSEASLLGGLCEYIDVIATAERDFRKQRTVVEWGELLNEYARRLFGAQESQDLLELYGVLTLLQDMGRVHISRVSFDVVAAWLARTTEESRSASGFLGGSLTFCSMLPMRSIPFTAICLIGLNYGDFPNTDRQPTYDLQRCQPKRGDRSRRADDRYQFLEVLLAARRSLYLSYLGQSLQSNDKLPPSVVVTELLELLLDGYGIIDITEHHPLHGFNSSYFREDSELFSYSTGDFTIARRLTGAGREGGTWWGGVIEDDVSTIEIDDLLRFFTHPQRYFVEQRLELPLPRDEEVPGDSEVFEVKGLGSYLVEQRLLSLFLEEEDPDLFHRRMVAAGLWPLGRPGEELFEEKRSELARFGEFILELDLGEETTALEIDRQVGGYRIKGRLGHIHMNGILLARYAGLRGRDLMQGWLYHLLAEGEPGAPARTMVVLKDTLTRFSTDMETPPSLEELVEIYVEGRRRPSPLLLEPALEYCRQKEAKRARIAPIDKARQVFRRSLEKGYEPSWQLLYQGCDESEIVDERFAGYAEKVVLPLWRATHAL